MADIEIFSLSVFLFPFLPGMFLIDALVFYFLANRKFRLAVPLWKIFTLVLLANGFSAVIGYFIPVSHHKINSAMWALLFLIITVILEWALYLPFFQRKKVTSDHLLIISFTGNIITFLLIVLYLMLAL